MPSNAPIAIFDGATTPVSHSFSPKAINGNIASFQEILSGVPIGYPVLTVSNREPVKGSAGVYRVTMKLVVPKVITTTDVSGKTVTSVDYSNSAEITLLLSERSSTQERKNIRVLASNLLMNASPAAVVDNLEFYW
jgi:hypothetical protein